MLTCTSETEWKIAYKGAERILESDADKWTELHKIYKNPSYYFKYYMKQIVENLDYNGSTPADQNHSSTLAHLGNGGNFFIAEQINLLIDRQIFQHQSRVHSEAKRRKVQEGYKSKIPGNRRVIDNEGILSLAKHPYDKFKQQLKKNLRYDLKDNGEDYFFRMYGACVDPSDRENCPYYQCIKIGDRCGCDFVHTYNMQCCHEICFHSKFKINLFSSRWLNDLTYNKLNCNDDKLLNYKNIMVEGSKYNNHVESSDEDETHLTDGCHDSDVFPQQKFLINQFIHNVKHYLN